MKAEWVVNWRKAFSVLKQASSGFVRGLDHELHSISFNLALVSVAAYTHANSPLKSGAVQVDGVKIAYRTQGHGTPMFLVHGFPLSGELFSKVRPILANRYNVVTPDLRGFGDSTISSGKGSVGTYAKDMFAVMDHLGIKKAIIGGMSMGGPVVLEMYREQPNRFKGLILIDTTTSPAAVVETYQWPGFGKQAEEKGVPSMAPLLMPNMLTAQTRLSNMGLVKGITGIVKKGSVAGAKFGGDVLANRPDSRGTKISVPVLIVEGQDDPIYPIEMQMKMHQDIKGSHLAVIPGAAHAAIIEASQCGAAILTWASSLRK